MREGDIQQGEDKHSGNPKGRFGRWLAELWAIGDFLTMFVLWMISGVVCHAAPDAALPSADSRPAFVTRKVEEKRVETIETGLEYMYRGALPRQGIGWWLNNELLVVNALQEVPEAKLKHLERVMLVDGRTGQTRTLVPDGAMVCWNSERQIAVFWPSNYNINMNDSVIWYARLDSQGNFERLAEIPSVGKFCRGTDIGLPDLRATLAKVLREADGYIQRKDADMPYRESAEAILVRPGKPPRKLGVPAGEIGDVRYLPYFNKYFIKNPAPTKHLAKDIHRRIVGGEVRLFDLPSFRLMSPEGDMEELPVPDAIFEFGIKGFGMEQPMPQGQLYVHNGYGPRQKPEGLFLLQGERLFRFWGGPGWFAPGSNEYALAISVAPDGCRIAFTHSAEWSFYSKNPIAIVNLCKEL